MILPDIWLRGDVIFTQCGATVIIKWSKTIQDRKETRTINIPYLGDSEICPIVALKTMLCHIPGSKNDPLFMITKKGIQWIELFNTDIKAYVLQCGYLSSEISIERGCRQGDPIATYLFLIGAEILSLLIKVNPHITGIKINNIEFKLTQLADDTTLMLHGTTHSLQSALNTLDIFGSFSGLKMNKEKTKVVCIGRKRYSREKLFISEKLDWNILILLS